MCTLTPFSVEFFFEFNRVVAGEGVSHQGFDGSAESIVRVEVFPGIHTQLLGAVPDNGVAQLRLDVAPCCAVRAGSAIAFLQEDVAQNLDLVLGDPLRAGAYVFFGREGGFIPDLQCRQAGDK